MRACRACTSGPSCQSAGKMATSPSRPCFRPTGWACRSGSSGRRVWLRRLGFDPSAHFHVYGRYAVGVVLVVFMPKTEGERARRFHKVLLDDAERTGIPEYRTHIGHMDWSRRKFDFNDHALGRTLSSIKGLLDPAGILLQGKSSIWTEHAIVKAGF